MSAQSTPNQAKGNVASSSQIASPTAINFAELGDHSIISKQLSNTILSSHVKGKVSYLQYHRMLNYIEI